MSRDTRRSMKRKAEEKAEEKAAEKTARTAISQPLPTNTKFGHASEVITRYFGLQGVPRRFTKPSSDNGSTSSLHSCPATSEDEYEDEEEIANMSPEPVLARQESQDSSALATEGLTATPEANHQNIDSPSTPRKRRKTTSEAGTPSSSDSHHYFPSPNLDEGSNEMETIEENPLPSPPQLLLSFRPIAWPSSDYQSLTQSGAVPDAKLSTRSLSPLFGGGIQVHQPQPIPRAHSAPHDQTKASPTPRPELTRSVLLDETDGSAPDANTNKSFTEDLPGVPMMSPNGIPTTGYHTPSRNAPVSRRPSPSPSRTDSRPEPDNLTRLSPMVQSPSPSPPECIDPPQLPTIDACFEPRTTPAPESHIEDSEPSRDATSPLEPKALSIQHGSNDRVSKRAARVKRSATKKRTFLPGSEEERKALVALYVQENGDIQTIRSALYHLSDGGFTRGRHETERLLRILGRAEDDGEVTLKVEHRRRVRELKRKDAQVESQTEEHHTGDESSDGRFSGVHIESIVESVAGDVGLQAEDTSPALDVHMDVEEAGDGLSARSQHQEATTVQTAEEEEHAEDIIYVFGGLRPSRPPLTTVKETTVKKPRKRKAEKTSGSRAFHSCVRCRVGLLDEINEEGMEPMAMD